MSEKYDVYYEKPKEDYQPYRDSDFKSTDSPKVLDVLGDLGRITYNGKIHNDGSGDIIFSLSSDGTSYNSQVYLEAAEEADLRTHIVKKIKLEHSGTDSAYRVEVW